MLYNYLKITVRILTRNKMVSMINVLGLALALSGGLLITLFIHDELSYDRFHKNADRIYRVTRNYVSPDGRQHMHLGHLAPPFAPLLKNDFPDILESVRTSGPFSPTIISHVSDQSKGVVLENAYFAEPSLFRIFSIEILSGGTRGQLEKPLTMMLSDKIAKKYFGKINVVGKEVTFYDRTVEITGTFKAFPHQSHWHPEVLISFSTLHDDFFFGAKQLQNNWESNSFLTYILVNDVFDPGKTERSFSSFIDKHMPNGGDAGKKSASTNLFLQPLTSIHLHSHLDSEAETNGNINHVYALGSVGVFLIIIACFNFINLSTARAAQRGKEVGLRKVSGALRKQLIFQYISESTLITLIAMVVAIAIASACLLWLNDFTGKSINLNHYLAFNTGFILTVFVIVVGILAGVYPAFVISSYKPVQILKGQSTSASKGSSLRKTLVVVQFSISTIMIIATLITYQQLEFLNNKELGYERDQIITIRYPDESHDHYDVFYNALKQHPSIVNVARSNRMPTVRLLETNYVERVDQPAEKKVIMKNVSIDQHFFDTYGIHVISGKNFTKKISKDDSFEDQVKNGFILNESACNLLGWSNPEAVGKEIVNGGVRGTIIGVVKDFHFESLHEPIAPIVFMTYAGFRQVSVLVSASKMKEAIAQIQKAWNQLGTQESLVYEFLSERYKRLYDSEARQQELFVIFALLAIFIASLGLFGLATFNAIQRSKEVSIRKVLGASVQSILQLLSKEIVILILISNAIAWPLAWYFMTEWLQGFAYRVDISVLTYMGAALLTLLITCITISTQTLKVALTNPATILRNE